MAPSDRPAGRYSGTLDLSNMGIETPETVAARIRRALPHVPAERIVVAPDCGLIFAACGCLRKDAGHGCGRGNRAAENCARVRSYVDILANIS
jgi:5-methyltetrahydropteroyltriglutamate--homocysteine methyltransferase